MVFCNLHGIYTDGYKHEAIQSPISENKISHHMVIHTTRGSNTVRPQLAMKQALTLQSVTVQHTCKAPAHTLFLPPLHIAHCNHSCKHRWGLMWIPMAYIIGDSAILIQIHVSREWLQCARSNGDKNLCNDCTVSSFISRRVATQSYWVPFIPTSQKLMVWFSSYICMKPLKGVLQSTCLYNWHKEHTPSPCHFEELHEHPHLTTQPIRASLVRDYSHESGWARVSNC